MITISNASPIDCRAMVQRLWDFLDEELEQETFDAIEAHVAACHSCAAHVAFARTFLATVKEAWEDDLGQTSPDVGALRSRVISQLMKHGYRTP